MSKSVATRLSDERYMELFGVFKEQSLDEGTTATDAIINKLSKNAKSIKVGQWLIMLR